MARSHGATVVVQSVPGYGAAVQAGVEAVTTDVVCVLDGDGSLDPGELPTLVERLLDGADLAVGRRMPVAGAAWPLHARVGNAVLAARLRRKFGLDVHDIGAVRAVRTTDAPRSRCPGPTFGLSPGTPGPGRSGRTAGRRGPRHVPAPHGGRLQGVRVGLGERGGHLGLLEGDPLTVARVHAPGRGQGTRPGPGQDPAGGHRRTGGGRRFGGGGPARHPGRRARRRRGRPGRRPHRGPEPGGPISRSPGAPGRLHGDRPAGRRTGGAVGRRPPGCRKAGPRSGAADRHGHTPGDGVSPDGRGGDAHRWVGRRRLRTGERRGVVGTRPGRPVTGRLPVGRGHVAVGHRRPDGPFAPRVLWGRPRAARC